MFKKRKQREYEEAQWSSDMETAVDNLEHQLEQLAWVLGYEWDPFMMGVCNYTRDSEVKFGEFSSGTYVKIKKYKPGDGKKGKK